MSERSSVKTQAYDDKNLLEHLCQTTVDESFEVPVTLDELCSDCQTKNVLETVVDADQHEDGPGGPADTLSSRLVIFSKKPRSGSC